MKLKFLVVGATGTSSPLTFESGQFNDGVPPAVTTDGSFLVTDIEADEQDRLPKQFALEQNYPNPFNPSTTIRFDVPKASHVTIKIYDILGHEVRTFVDKKYQPGSHSVVWDGSDKKGLHVSSGEYFIRMHAGEFVETKKMLLIR